jgi:toxin-antitoxin system PIN domain toxin
VSARIALLDVNVLVALFDPAHAHHEPAHDWFARIGCAAWATCPITENGLVRVVSHPSYPTVEALPADVIEGLRTFTHTHPGHEFWPDSVSLTDDSLFSAAFITASGSVADAYLLALAVGHGGRLATFDRSMSVAWVRGADPGVLEVIPS